MMIPYVDMDGVLCDFEGRVAEIAGKPFALLSREEIWKAIASDPTFYLHLPWTKTGKELWKILHEGGLDPWICSASSSHVILSTQHKYMWCERELSLNPNRIIVVPHKSDKAKLARKNFLIDDRPQNVQEWREAGGAAYLYHDEPSDPVNVSGQIWTMKAYGW